MTFSYLGNRVASSTAPFDVRLHRLIDKEHVRGFGTCFKRSHKSQYHDNKEFSEISDTTLPNQNELDEEEQQFQ